MWCCIVLYTFGLLFLTFWIITLTLKTYNCYGNTVLTLVNAIRQIWIEFKLLGFETVENIITWQAQDKI